MRTTTTMDLELDARLFPSAASALRRCIRTALSHPAVQLRYPNAASLSIAVRPNQEMKTLNQRYRKRSKIPNVLSFPLRSSEIASTDDASSALLGEILIAYPHILRDAQRFGRSPIEHIQWLAVHGLLHLLNFDHEKERDAREMERIEEEIMKPLI